MERKELCDVALSPQEPERCNPRWEGIRQRLMEVMEYGAKEVRYSNDVVYGVAPDEDVEILAFPCLTHSIRN